ncbi:unnamed protein product [Echinostoma caproni]|uniref:Microtubule-associated protein n=1 Tax=Echinostoma caproni TaxID=27848 RepID=A0A183AAP7_9TREM|nr:unnamed protein product [Echinostoma caproni]
MEEPSVESTTTDMHEPCEPETVQDSAEPDSNVHMVDSAWDQSNPVYDKPEEHALLTESPAEGNTTVDDHLISLTVSGDGDRGGGGGDGEGESREHQLEMELIEKIQTDSAPDQSSSSPSSPVQETTEDRSVSETPVSEEPICPSPEQPDVDLSVTSDGTTEETVESVEKSHDVIVSGDEPSEVSHSPVDEVPLVTPDEESGEVNPTDQIRKESQDSINGTETGEDHNIPQVTSAFEPTEKSESEVPIEMDEVTEETGLKSQVNETPVNQNQTEESGRVEEDRAMYLDDQTSSSIKLPPESISHTYEPEFSEPMETMRATGETPLTPETEVGQWEMHEADSILPLSTVPAWLDREVEEPLDTPSHTASFEQEQEGKSHVEQLEEISETAKEEHLNQVKESSEDIDLGEKSYEGDSTVEETVSHELVVQQYHPPPSEEGSAIPYSTVPEFLDKEVDDTTVVMEYEHVADQKIAADEGEDIQLTAEPKSFAAVNDAVPDETAPSTEETLEDGQISHENSIWEHENVTVPTELDVHVEATDVCIPEHESVEEPNEKPIQDQELFEAQPEEHREEPSRPESEKPATIPPTTEVVENRHVAEETSATEEQVRQLAEPEALSEQVTLIEEIAHTEEVSPEEEHHTELPIAYATQEAISPHFETVEEFNETSHDQEFISPEHVTIDDGAREKQAQQQQQKPLTRAQSNEPIQSDSARDQPVCFTQTLELEEQRAQSIEPIEDVLVNQAQPSELVIDDGATCVANVCTPVEPVIQHTAEEAKEQEQPFTLINQPELAPVIGAIEQTMISTEPVAKMDSQPVLYATEEHEFSSITNGELVEDNEPLITPVSVSRIQVSDHKKLPTDAMITSGQAALLISTADRVHEEVDLVNGYSPGSDKENDNRAEFEERYARLMAKFLPRDQTLVDSQNRKQRSKTLEPNFDINELRNWNEPVTNVKQKSATLGRSGSRKRPRLLPKPAVNDDHLFPDSVTPSKVDRNLSVRSLSVGLPEGTYDVPYIDDDAFVPRKLRDKSAPNAVNGHGSDASTESDEYLWDPSLSRYSALDPAHRADVDE